MYQRCIQVTLLKKGRFLLCVENVPVSSGLYIYFWLSFYVGCRNPLCHHLIFYSGKRKKNSSVSAQYHLRVSWQLTFKCFLPCGFTRQPLFVMSCFVQVTADVSQLLGEHKVDAILCVAGGWAGGSCSSKGQGLIFVCCHINHLPIISCSSNPAGTRQA